MGQFVGQLIKAYRSGISPLLPPACRMVPTCSVYAEDAVQRFGVLKGSIIVIKRLLKCHPFSRTIVDPLPTGECS